MDPQLEPDGQGRRRLTEAREPIEDEQPAFDVGELVEDTNPDTSDLPDEVMDGNPEEEEPIP